jgi:hypothetical protein
MFFFPLLGVPVRAQTDISALYAQLTQPSTTDTAARAIADEANRDPAVKEFVAKRIPSLLVSGRRNEGQVWRNAIRLAGQLKVVGAVPALKGAFSLGPIRGGYDNESSEIILGKYSHLQFDIVARALADIGDPSIPSVADVLSHGDAADRRRAVYILLNINSPVANQAMRNHLYAEQDAGIRDMIQNVLPLP